MIRAGCWSTWRSRSPTAPTTISDVAVLADQAALFGPVASDSTCWRLLERLDAAQLGAVARARAAAREVVWAQRAELTGQPFPPARAAGRALPGLVIDLDASIVVCHSEKEQAAPTFKKTFGYHPMLAFCDNTGEFLAAALRRGNAGSNTAADHITVLDAALAQIPDQHRHGTPILVRADAAGCTQEFLAHIRSLRDTAVSCEFSVGWAITRQGTDRDHRHPEARCGPTRSTPTADTATAPGWPRSPACCPRRALAGYPAGTRVIVRRERPHPGAQLDAFEEARRLALHRVRHRHRVRAARPPRRPPPRARPGRGPHPLREGHRPRPLPVPVVRDQRRLADRRHARRRPARLDPAPAPARRTCAKAEPKTLRYRLLHVAARLTRGQRRLWLRIQRSWPWAHDLAAAFARLATLPVPDRLISIPTRRAAGATGRTARRPSRHAHSTGTTPTKINPPNPRSADCSVNHRG